MPATSNARLDSLDDLFTEQLRDLLDAENRLTKALPQMAKAAHNPELKHAFEEHLKETKSHVERLREVFSMLGKKPSSVTCEAMKGIIAEGEEMIKAKGNDDVKDAALIAAAQRVEHYEIASYGSARSFAEGLGHKEAARILQQTLTEEGNANKKLTHLAENGVNQRASAAHA